MEKKEKRVRWILESMDYMWKGSRTYRWFEIKLMKEMNKAIRPRKVKVLPLP